MATRGEKIYSRVWNKLPQELRKEIAPSKIFAVATEVSKTIAEEFTCIESSVSLPIVANTASYDLTTISGSTTGFFRLKLIAPPTTSNTKFTEFDSDSFDNLERYSSTTIQAYDQYFKIWDDTIKFYPTPTSSATYTIYYYKIPTTTISTSVSPETPQQFDNAIILGTLEELLASDFGDLSDKYSMKYMQSKSECFLNWRNTKTTSHNVVYRDV